MIRYRYQHAEGDIRTDDFPAIVHLFVQADHEQDGQNVKLHLVLTKWLQHENLIDHRRSGCMVIKNLTSRDLATFDNTGYSGQLDVPVQQLVAPAMLVYESKPIGHTAGFSQPRRRDRMYLVCVYK